MSPAPLAARALSPALSHEYMEAGELRRCRAAALAHLCHVGVLAVAVQLLVVRQLPLELFTAGVERCVGVGPALVGDEDVVVLGVDDHLNTDVVLFGVEDHLDFLDAVVVLGQLRDFLLRKLLEGLGYVHVPPGDGHDHAITPFTTVRDPLYSRTAPSAAPAINRSADAASAS